jgi:hypothetical protein
MIAIASTGPERTQCPADTSAGVALVKSTGPGACLLGKTWGYDQTSIWVADGCSGEFVTGQPPVADTERQAPSYPIVYGGINTLSGTRSVMGSHPFWLANDRVMADEFFRSSFTGGVWVNGELLPGLWYHAAVANNLSQLGIAANQLDRGLGSRAIASEGTMFLGSGRGRCLFSIKAEA